MRAIILAAGEGTRLKKYTEELPKGMLSFAGKSIIERQLETFRAVGIDKITIIRGFEAEKIDFPGVDYYLNEAFGSTNMLESLFCAEEQFTEDIIVSYADILFEESLLRGLVASEFDIAVTVDTEWEDYWRMRYAVADFDTESLSLSGEIITELGVQAPPLAEIDARYVGLMKFSLAGLTDLKRIYHRFRDECWDSPWQVSGKPFRKAYLTDMLQALIEDGVMVNAYKTRNGWIEFDTNKDYEKAIEWHKAGELENIIRLD